MFFSLKNLGKDLITLVNWKQVTNLFVFVLLLLSVSSAGMVCLVTVAVEINLPEAPNFLIGVAKKLATFPWYLSVPLVTIAYSLLVIFSDYHNLFSGKSSGGHS
jgi:hypothetical protein